MGKTQNDSEVLAEGQQVITACVFIWRDQNGTREVLLAKRAKTKKFLPGVYEMPGGHIEFAEEIKSGLAREVREELHVDVTIGDPFYVYDYTNLIKKSHTVEVVYFAQLQPDAVVQINPEDHSEYGWFDEQQVGTVIADNRKNLFKSGALEMDTTVDPELAAIYKGFRRLHGDSEL